MSYIRNTGINSMSELFAMKKNMASQAKLNYKMSSMTKDFYHRKFNMNQDIKKMSDELIKIQSSTGYVLDSEKTANPGNRPRRSSYAPKVYLPPIGVRLVKKYVGIDMARGSSFSEQPPSRDKVDIAETKSGLPELSRSMRSILLKRPIRIKLSNATDQTHLPDKETRQKLNMKIVVNDNDDAIVNEWSDVTEKTDARQKDCPEITDTEESEEGVNLVFVTAERRSSRSTFRKRASARLISQTSFLSEYNLGLITTKGSMNKSKGTVPKLEPGKFLLDYGDGKLRTTMEIPKMKDCSRPWCNPTCKTCRNRTYSRPCFVLLPAGSEKQSMLLLQKHHASNDRTAVGKTLEGKQGAINDREEPTEEVKPEGNGGQGVEESSQESHALIENCDDVENEQSDDNEIDEDDKEMITTIAKLLHVRKDTRKRGYDKSRLDDLAQPRGGPPAEVRFSKTSLKRTQKQLTENARTQELSKLEKDNLTILNGKISMFLALFNQYESTSVPKMVHLPIREDVCIPRRKPKKAIIRKRKRVSFDKNRIYD